MRSMLTCLWFVAAGLFSVSANASFGIQENGYDIYVGDINGDGLEDLYFEYHPPIIILHGDIATPISMPRLPDFVLNGTWDGSSMSYGLPVEITLDESIVSGMELLDEAAGISGDFNGDDVLDLLVQASILLILHGNGNSLPTVAQTFPIGDGTTESALLLSSTNPEFITVRDTNGDGRDDIVITGSGNTTFLASASGTFDSYGSPIIPGTANMAGASGGEFRVNESGAATYSIPIATAAGTAGVVPEVSLNYSGNAGNGIVGKSWSVGGLSGISRCRQTLAIDGGVAPINWTESDRFCLDGQRLIKITGSQYGVKGATYKTEMDSFAKITSVGGSLGKPGYFKVERKDGSVSYYGQTSDSRQLAGNNILTWMQNRFEDSVGNRIEFQYEGDANTGHRIKEIRYAFGGGSHAAEVGFSYESRSDYIRGFTAGFEFTTTRRLNKITSISNGRVIREYKLGYLPIPSGSYPDKTSLLASMQECVGSSCLPAVSFEWLQPGIAYPAAGTETTDFSPASSRFLVNHLYADFNGDGKQDIVWIEGDDDGGDTDTRVKYAISNGTKYVRQSFIAGKFTDHYFTGTDVDEDFRLRVLDYNGDGRHDIAIFNERAAYGALANRWTIFLSRYRGGAWKLDSNPIYTSLSDKDAIFADFDSDGLADYISAAGNYVKVRLLQPYGAAASSDNYYRFSTTEQSYALSVSGATLGNPEKRVPDTLGDFNGDGAMDLLVATYSNEAYCRYVGGGGGDDPPIHEPFLPRYLVLPECGSGYVRDYRTVYDGHRVAVFDQAAGNFKSMALLSNSKVDREPIAADINGDGLTDIGYVSGTTFRVRLSTGTGFVEIGSQVNAEKASLADINSDGYPDVYWQAADGYLKVRYFNPAGNNFGSAQNFRYVGTSDKNNNWFADVDGDSQADFHKYTGSSGKLYTYLANLGVSEDKNQPRNVISRIDNGLGNITEIRYANMVGSDIYSRLEMSTTTEEQCHTEPREPDGSGGYIGGGTYCYPVTTGDPSTLYESLNGPWDLPSGSHTLGKDRPVLDILAPMFLVSKVESSAPAAGINPGSVNHSAKSSVSYHYHQMKLQAAGRGMLGFQKLSSTDNQTGVVTETVYRQDFPFTGMPLQTETRTASGKLLSKASNTWRLQGWSGSGTPSAPYQPYIYKAVEETYDLNSGGTAQGDLLQTLVTENSYDAYGNALSIKVTTSDAVSGEQYVKNTVNTYGSTLWAKEKGRLSNTKVTTTRPNKSPHVRESSFTYHTSGILKGLLKTEVIEPNKAAFTQTTSYEYDQFGNVTKKTLSAVGEASRSTRMVYDPTGRYAIESYNALGHRTEKVVARNHFGAPLIVEGMNGLRSYFAYDAMGREGYSWNNAGSDKFTEYERCSSGCITGAKYKVSTSSSTGAWSREYYDALGRIMRTEAQGFNKIVYADKEYDSLDRVKFVSEPYFSGDTRMWTETEYDLLGRPTRIIAPDNSESAIVYTGLKTTTTNDKGQKKIEEKNVAGELVEVTDAIDGRLSYEYDYQGNLHKVKSRGDSDIGANPIIVTINYDHLGRKTDMSDPDKGNWSYEYNKYGELKKQTNGNGHTVAFTYDRLGRKKTRIDRKNGSTVTGNVIWYYDSAENGLGQLEMVADSVIGYQAIYQYDSLSRNDTQLVDFDGAGPQPAYVTTKVFDGYGRVVRTYDALDSVLSGGQSGTRNYYNDNGYLYKVTDLATGDLIHQVKEQTARGQLHQQLLGNGATTTFTYQASTGRLLNQTSTVLGTFGIQNIAYKWDTLGNLESRENRSGSKANNPLRESFCYDKLNRLVKTHIGSSNYDCTALTEAEQSVKYNSIGNITWKQGVGGYSYGSVSLRPHAVGNAGGVTYSYDDNGNMTADGFDGGRTIDYTIFDMAERIAKTSSGHITEFKYGPDRSRYYRKDSNGSGTTETWYIGNIERIQDSSAPNEIQWKRHLVGTAVYTVKTNLSYVVQSTKKIFLYKDHLGSMDLLTDELASIQQLMSFDAWGQRRSPFNWENFTPSPPNGIDSLTTRGYTGHEMVDGMGIIHMNGRIYDARLGLFLQADPFIQAPSDTQSFDRYTYVRNNPLALIDPSGYSWFSKTRKKLKKWRRKSHNFDLAYQGYKKSMNETLRFHFKRHESHANSVPFIRKVDNYFATHRWAQAVGTAVAAYYGGPYGAAAVSAHATYAQGGSINDIRTAGQAGFASGSLLQGINGYYGDTWTLGRVGWTATAGGGASELYGGQFKDGFKVAFVIAGASYIYSNVGSAYNQSGEPHLWQEGKSDVGKQLRPDELAKIKNGTMKAPLSSDQSAFMKTVAKGPFMDAFGEFHDGFHSYPYVPGDQLSLIMTMPPSYVVTVVAAMRPYILPYTMAESKEGYGQ